VRLAFEHARLLTRLDLDLVDEAVRRGILPRLEVARALEVRVLAVGRHQRDRHARLAALRHDGPRILVERHRVGPRPAASTATATEAAATAADARIEATHAPDRVVL